MTPYFEGPGLLPTNGPRRGAGSEPGLLDSLGWDFVETGGPDLLARWGAHHRFTRALRSAGFGAAASRTDGHGPGGALAGLDLAAPDHLGLAAHPAIRAAAAEALARWGTDAADDGPARRLEARLAVFLGLAHVATFSSGRSAATAAIRLLVREGDHVVLDSLAQAALGTAAVAATGHVHRVPHLSHEAVEGRLADIRAHDPRCGILVATDALFPLDAEVPDLPALRAACRRHGATLLVDVSHDLGAVGADGRGLLGEAGLLGGVDVVTGGFRRVFGTGGGFVGCRDLSLADAFRSLGRDAGPEGTGPDILTPFAAATAAAALDVVLSPEGGARRGALLRNAVTLRGALSAAGLRVLGRPGPVVPVDLGGVAAGRLTTRTVRAEGASVSLVEYPVVSRHLGRWCLNVSADHDRDALLRFAVVARGEGDGAAAGRGPGGVA